ncbi:rhamnosyltransferase [Dyella sp. OK004]|uniref:rhamnan synthesis F family protein n=1 Tax=Dyella sp. OK004 TaxID=1855292 RepID=UPI0008EE0B7E|nr:rhamnan synthesis F family protein [Dyella sp. OK004]SFS07874.1 rhamnosyltransferase [Dyella sp. OK004]
MAESKADSSLTMRRLCVFSFYDSNGVVDEYVTYFLKEMSRYVERILFYSNGPLGRDAEITLRGLGYEVIQRSNVGFDVLAYKEGLHHIDFDKDGRYDEVLMVNHTCYGPIFPVEELFSAMSQRRCDFWGITAHFEMPPNPSTGTTLYQLDSNFIAVRKDLLRSQAFRKYWEAIEESTTHEAATQSHEAVFTKYFTKLGYVCESYLDCTKYGTLHPAIDDIDETIIDRNPILKRHALFSDPRTLEHNAVDLPRALRVIEDTSDYDRSMIWKNIVRSADLRTLNTNAALTSVFPDVRLKEGEYPRDRECVAVCAHVYYTDMLDELLALTDTIPCAYDFIATTETPEKKQAIEDKVRGRKNVANVIVRVVEQNRGRDMSSLFITCRDLFLEDRYDVVCRLHTKKSPQVAAGRANGFKRHMFENLLNSPGYTANVLDMFHDNPWIGIAVPPLVHIGYPTMGHVWFNNLPRAAELATVLDLKVPMDSDTPVGAFGTMFWFRPKALRKLFTHPWKWTDFNAEPHHVDGGLAHVLERLICYVAQDARYTTQQIISSHLAGRNYAMLEYKLQRLSASLPNGDFNYGVQILDEWKLAGYRNKPDTSQVAEQVAAAGLQQPTIRQAWGEVMLAIKRSIAHRSPGATNLLRPVYRSIVGKK